MKKKLYHIHKVTGLTLGVLLFLSALSGALITFRHEIMPLVYPQFRVEPRDAKMALPEVIRKVRIHLEDRVLTNYYGGETPEDSALALFRDKERFLPGILTIDPYTGVVIGEMSLVENVFAVALFFHANFFLGSVGEILVGFLGLILVFFVVSGVMIWLPRRQTVGSKLKKLFSRSGPQGLHHLLGISFALPLLFVAMTGFLTVFDLGYTATRLLRSEPPRPEELVRKRECDLDADVRALSLLTDTQVQNLISVHFCGKKNALMRVSYNQTDGYGRLLIDSSTGEFVQRFDSSRDPKSWNVKRLIIYPLHSGELLGLPGRILVLLSGLGLMGLFTSGLFLYLRRLKVKRSLYVPTIIPKEIP